MTVMQLIVALQEFPSDAEVFPFVGYEGQFSVATVTGVAEHPESGDVWIFTDKPHWVSKEFFGKPTVIKP